MHLSHPELVPRRWAWRATDETRQDSTAIQSRDERTTTKFVQETVVISPTLVFLRSSILGTSASARRVCRTELRTEWASGQVRVLQRREGRKGGRAEGRKREAKPSKKRQKDTVEIEGRSLYSGQRCVHSPYQDRLYNLFDRT